MDGENNLSEFYCNILKFLQQEFIEFLRVFSFRDKSDDFKKELINDYYNHVESIFSWLPRSIFVKFYTLPLNQSPKATIKITDSFDKLVRLAVCNRQSQE